MAQSKFVNLQGSVMHYVKAGSGEEPLLFFHGFGQDHTLYLPLVRSLGHRYALYMFDLFFHGQSAWGHGERALEKKDWQALLAAFLQEEKLESFSVAGYSLGGKFALATVELYPQKVNKLFLIAPDGIHTSLWYSFATYPVAMRRFFRSTIHHYDRFLKLAAAVNRLGLLDKSVIRFADYQMSTEEKRKRVYYSWVVFRHMTFDLSKLAALINDHNIRVVIIAGKYDKVIEPKNLAGFANKIVNKRFEIADAGHSGLVFESLHFFAEH